MKRFLPIAIVLLVLVIYQKYRSSDQSIDIQESSLQSKVKVEDNTVVKMDNHVKAKMTVKESKSFASHSLKAAPQKTKENPYGAVHQSLFDNPTTKKIIYPLGKNPEMMVTTEFAGKDISKDIALVLDHNLDCLESKTCGGDSSVELQSQLENRMMLEALMLYNSSLAHGDTKRPIAYKTLMRLIHFGDSQIKDISLNYLFTQYSDEFSLQSVLHNFSGAEIPSVYKNIKASADFEKATRYFASQNSENLFYTVEGVEKYVKSSSTLAPLIKTLCSSLQKVTNQQIHSRIISRLNRLSEGSLGREKACQ